MTAEIISVGTELLLGDIIDTDAAFFSRELAALGISVYRRTTVGDNLERMVKAIAHAFESADIVITAGGLGPTADDITKEAAATYFGLELILDEEIKSDLEAYFRDRGYTMTENNVRQAYIPAGAKALLNRNGTAPGVLIEKDGKAMFLLPGPPNEAEPMFLLHVRPYLVEKSDCVLVSKSLRMCGIGESAMETLVLDLLDHENPTVAPYAGNSETRLRVTARAADEETAFALISPIEAELRDRLGNYIYGCDDDTLESVVLSLLKEKGLKLACAESCTGGALTARLTSVPGASEVLLETCVTYSNEAKINRLGVKRETIEKFGAVSSETAKEMAEGATRNVGADVGLSITGVAGPGGGTEEKPVGLVYFGLYANGRTESFESRSSGDRERIRTRSVARALEILWRNLRSI